VRPEVSIKTKEENPDHSGEGEIEAPILVIDKISADLERIIKDHKNVVLNAHPFIAAYLTKGFPSERTKWVFEHKQIGRASCRERAGNTVITVVNVNKNGE